MKTMAAESNKVQKTETPLITGLNQVLADTYSLMGLTHLAHWNVEGPSFFALHKAFEEQYQELFEEVDVIAERIRALGGYAMGGLGRLSKVAGMEEFSAPQAQKDYVAALIGCHEKLIQDAVHARDMAGEINDLESQDLMIEKITWHEKTLWMLKSFLKQG
ncbi:MAG TPA: DNA starvation/stationary phase protection protein [Candidatus Saccharimonadales bacterium]|nr:DNA starvation/stationary phase protection protein [Candidatus Saccharimonadales bacterium]